MVSASRSNSTESAETLGNWDALPAAAASRQGLEGKTGSGSAAALQQDSSAQQQQQQGHQHLERGLHSSSSLPAGCELSVKAALLGGSVGGTGGTAAAGRLAGQQVDLRQELERALALKRSLEHKMQAEAEQAEAERAEAEKAEAAGQQGADSLAKAAALRWVLECMLGV